MLGYPAMKVLTALPRQLLTFMVYIPKYPTPTFEVPTNNQFYNFYTKISTAVIYEYTLTHAY